MKIEAGNTEYFLIDNIPYQRGNYEIKANAIRFGLRRPNGEFLLIAEYTEFTDNTSSDFANVQALVDYVKTFIFLST